MISTILRILFPNSVRYFYLSGEPKQTKKIGIGDIILDKLKKILKSPEGRLILILFGSVVILFFLLLVFNEGRKSVK